MKQTHSKSHYSLLFSTLMSMSLTAPFVLANEAHPHPESHNHEQHAHEHGVAQMQMVIAGKDVLIEVASPLYNVIGFEHKPNNEQQKKAIEQQFHTISQGDLITLTTAANCRLASKEIDLPFAENHAHKEHEHEHEHESEHKHESEHAHKNMRFEYQLHCESPQKLSDVNTQKLFTAWPNLQKLNVEWVYNHRQSATTLNPDQPILSLQ